MWGGRPRQAPSPAARPPGRASRCRAVASDAVQAGGPPCWCVNNSRETSPAARGGDTSIRKVCGYRVRTPSPPHRWPRIWKALKIDAEPLEGRFREQLRKAPLAWRAATCGSGFTMWGCWVERLPKHVLHTFELTAFEALPDRRLKFRPSDFDSHRNPPPALNIRKYAAMCKPR